jgi:SAM-dependent methyltransferase
MQNWFESDLGRYVLAREREWFEATSADIFGFNAMQVGLCHEDFLAANRMPYRFCAAVGGGGLRCRPEFLPVDCQSLDLLALPHALEFSPNPHQLLREVERVLRPEGRLLLAGFNPMSLWGIKRALGPKGDYPWQGRFLRLARIKDWLSLLGFDLLAGRMICYAPPVNRAAWLDGSRFLEAAGDRWWALGGGVYLLHAVKRVPGMRVISPRWDKQYLAKPALARPTNRIIGQ